MATHTAMLMAFFWLTAPMYGLSNACTVRIGHYLGAADAEAARQVSMLSYVAACSLSMCVALLLVLLRSQLGHVFSGDEEVVEGAAGRF